MSAPARQPRRYRPPLNQPIPRQPYEYEVFEPESMAKAQIYMDCVRENMELDLTEHRHDISSITHEKFNRCKRCEMLPPSEVGELFKKMDSVFQRVAKAADIMNRCYVRLPASKQEQCKDRIVREHQAVVKFYDLYFKPPRMTTMDSDVTADLTKIVEETHNVTLLMAASYQSCGVFTPALYSVGILEDMEKEMNTKLLKDIECDAKNIRQLFLSGR